MVEIPKFVLGNQDEIVLTTPSTSNESGSGVWGRDAVKDAEYFSQQPEIPFKETKKGDIVAFETTNGEQSFFVVTGFRGKVYDRGKFFTRNQLRGILVHDARIAQRLGIPQVIPNSVIHGSTTNGKNSYSERIIQGIFLDCYMPLVNLGSELFPEDKDLSLHFINMPVNKAGVFRAAEEKRKVSEAINAYRLPKFTTYDETQSWPCLRQGVTLEDIKQTLYLAAYIVGGGIRGRYWINPQTGELTKMGIPAGSVWDTVEEYINYYQQQPADMYLRRIATFSYWAARIGLQAPEDLQTKLREADLI